MAGRGGASHVHKDACMCTRAPSHTFILFPRPPPPPALSFPHLGRCELLVERHACKILSWPLPRLSRVPSLPFSFLSVSPTAGGTRNIHTGHIYIYIYIHARTHTHTHTHTRTYMCACVCVCVCVCVLQVVLVAAYARKEGLKNCLGLVGILQRRASVPALNQI